MLASVHAGLVIRPMREGDIERSRVVGQMAWSDMAFRDIGKRVRYPMRSRRIVETYMEKEPGGCLVAEVEGNVVGAAYCHVWGRVGWIGPLEVVPEMQRRGIGTALLKSGEEYLRSRGCVVVGLETMPQILSNIRFYMSAGYRTDKVTLLAEKALDPLDIEDIGATEVTDGIAGILPQVSRLSAAVSPLLDYAQEFELTVSKGLGSVFACEEEGRIVGLVALHTYPRTIDADYASIKVLLVDPCCADPEGVFNALMTACEARARKVGKRRMYARFEADDSVLYNAMEARRYHLRGTNVRMVKGRGGWRSMYHISSWAG
jgi:ribosomal protein S18 acetylase RimI-like enzyme